MHDRVENTAGNDPLLLSQFPSPSWEFRFVAEIGFVDSDFAGRDFDSRVTLHGEFDQETRFSDFIG